MLEDIKARIADIKCDYDKMNPYQLYFDCQALINEVEYWKSEYQKLELSFDLNDDGWEGKAVKRQLAQEEKDRQDYLCQLGGT